MWLKWLADEQMGKFYGQDDKRVQVILAQIVVMQAGYYLKLKGSIGDGPNHSNFSHQSSVKILGIQSVKIQYILLENSKNSGSDSLISFNIFENICEIPTEFHQTLSKSQCFFRKWVS